MLSRFSWHKSNRNKSQSALTFVPAQGLVEEDTSNSPPASSRHAHAHAHAHAQAQAYAHGAHTQQADQSQGQAQSPGHRSSLLSRSRSQRFSPSSIAERFTSNRHSYIPSSASQSFLGSEGVGTGTGTGTGIGTGIGTGTGLGTTTPTRQGSGYSNSTPPVPDFTEAHTLRYFQQQTSSSSASIPSIYSPTGNERGESLSASFSALQLLPASSEPLPSPSVHEEEVKKAAERDFMTTRTASTQGKSSSDSTGSAAAAAPPLDRWSQRRLQRLNTEQGFREQRQGISQAGAVGAATPTTTAATPTPAGAGAGAGVGAGAGSGAGPASPQLHSGSANSSPAFHHDGPQVRLPTHNSTPNSSNQYSPPAVSTPYQNHTVRQLQQARSFTQSDDTSPDSAHKARVARQSQGSLHLSGAAMATSAPSMPHGNGHQQQAKDGRTGTPQLEAEEMSPEEVQKLVADHRELRDKYTKVKKYYFEKEDQVKALQDSLAHQRIAQSRTSLDDSEYATRFNRLDGLIAQLSFSIRKSWKSVPTWLHGSLNKDAITIGKQEMTAAGRAIISQWLVEEVFNTYFHPDLDITLSAQLKAMQKTIRRHAPAAVNPEDEKYLTSKIVAWRLTTLEGLQEMLRSPQCETNRLQLIDLLKHQLMSHLQQHLDNPPMSDLEGGVHMIIELGVQMTTHLPQESRDVQIDYFMPGTLINYDNMKSESGIPALGTSIADEAAERASLKSAASDITEGKDSLSADGAGHTKRGMLSALTGGSKKRDPNSRAPGAGAGGSSTSLSRPESAAGDRVPGVRMAVGIAAYVRNRTVLVKAPIFATS